MPIILYSLLGPPIGALVFWSITLLPVAIFAMFRDASWHADSWSSIIKLLVGWYLPYSYLIGVLPAAGAGVSHVVCLRKQSTTRARIALVVATGAVLQFVLLLFSGALGDVAMALGLVAAATAASGLIAMAVETMQSKVVRNKSTIRNDA